MYAYDNEGCFNEKFHLLVYACSTDIDIYTCSHAIDLENDPLVALFVTTCIVTRTCVDCVRLWTQEPKSTASPFAPGVSLPLLGTR